MLIYGVSYGHDGKSSEKILEFETIGITIADAEKKQNSPALEYMKVYVDGIEH